MPKGTFVIANRQENGGLWLGQLFYPWWEPIFKNQTTNQTTTRVGLGLEEIGTED
jgi:hypothetical protein